MLTHSPSKHTLPVTHKFINNLVIFLVIQMDNPPQCQDLLPKTHINFVIIISSSSSCSSI